MSETAPHASFAGAVRPGDVFAGRYRVEKLLKAGGMGAVYVAEHTATKRKIALKLMHPEIVGDDVARARFAQEAQASAIIHSVNVVDVYDAGVDPASGMPFLAMELLTGAELGELVRARGPLPFDAVADYVAQTARALDRAHAAGIVHRDLKPENLFLAVREGEPPRVKVLDFGIARFLATAGAATTRASGTPLYMAPEQSKKGGAIGPQTDIWALGLIAYALLVGRTYWDAEDVHGLFAEIFFGDYEAATARARRAGIALPKAFDAWFARCVHLDPTKRFARAGEAAAELAAALGAQLPASAPSLAELPTAPLDRSGTATPLELATTIHGDSHPAIPSSGSAMTPAEERATTPRTTTRERPKRRALVVAPAIAIVIVGGGAAFLATRGSARAPLDRLSAGLGDTTCAVDRGGAVTCIGATFEHQAAASRTWIVPLRAAAAEIAVGKHHACALLRDGAVQCWGDNGASELGDGTTAPRRAPVDVPGVRGALAIASSIHGSCVRLADGALKCWGGNHYGQIGDGTNVDRVAPTDVEGMSGATSLALGQDHACAVVGGSVSCWGRNAEGEVGDGSTSDRNVPTRVDGLSGAVALALGGHFSCALLGDGTVSCWGSNTDGSLGDGSKHAFRAKPGPVVGLADVVEIVAGWRHACARTKSGTVRCWGENTFGQIGDGTTTARPIPVDVKGVFVRLAAGRGHTCGLRGDGSAACWGKNEEGQLGDGTRTNRLEPVAFVTVAR